MLAAACSMRANRLEEGTLKLTVTSSKTCESCQAGAPIVLLLVIKPSPLTIYLHATLLPRYKLVVCSVMACGSVILSDAGSVNEW
jgi:hypothetical protein